MTESLSLLAPHMEKKEREILQAVAKRISKGHMVWDSFLNTGAFPPFFISMLQVGELTGTLPEELSAAALYYKKEDAYIKKIQGALAYPLFVFMFSLVVLLIILLFILPSFQLLFETLGIPLPAGAAMGILVGGFLKGFGQEIAILFLLGLLFLLLYGETEAGREKRARLLYRVSFYRQLLLIRFALTLAAFLESGKPISASLGEAGRVLGNPAAKEAVFHVEQAVERGEDFPRALEASGFFSPLLIELSRVGMESGQLPKFLRKAAELMESETEEKIRRFRAILEPAMLLFVGGMTAFIIFSVMLPVFQAAGSHLG